MATLYGTDSWNAAYSLFGYKARDWYKNRIPVTEQPLSNCNRGTNVIEPATLPRLGLPCFLVVSTLSSSHTYPFQRWQNYSAPMYLSSALVSLASTHIKLGCGTGKEKARGRFEKRKNGKNKTNLSTYLPESSKITNWGKNIRVKTKKRFPKSL